MPHQIIFVHGFFGWGSNELMQCLPYWGEAKNADPFKDKNVSKAKFASVGPISSNHDRACELFYQIKGGDCDYGAEHAKKHKHQQILEQWEKGAQPLYSNWDESNPIHLVCHSQGTPTARMLQYLLQQNYFAPKHQTNANWIKSISSISGAHNGTTLLYSLGCSDTTGKVKDQPSLIRWFSNRLPYLTKHSAKLNYNFDLGQWGKMLNNDRVKPFIFGEDNAFYDLSLHGMHQCNQILKEYPETYYFSYTTQQTVKFPFTDSHIPGIRMNLLLWCFSWLMGKYSFSEDFRKSLAGDYNNSDWRKNDGITPTYAQEFPRYPKQHAHKYCSQNTTNFEPGLWHIMEHELSAWDHWDVTIFPGFCKTRQKQRRFYQTLFNRLNDLQ